MKQEDLGHASPARTDGPDSVNEAPAMVGLSANCGTAAPPVLQMVRAASDRGKRDMLEPMAIQLDRLEHSRLTSILEKAGIGEGASALAEVIRRYVLSDTRASLIYDEETPEGRRYADISRTFG